MAFARRPMLPGLVALALAGLLVLQFSGSAFVAEPATRSARLAKEAALSRHAPAPAEAAAMAVGAGLLTAEPAHAGVLFDEIIPYSAVTAGTILWGIVLGFVLLRLQEAFPE
mmetsp:Transcript_16883/g.34447  ORF Transcript_16883/g.34447 Transcript_16883/m.34447 type:complete len:112 (-) Transcript_16883:140-475(-)